MYRRILVGYQETEQGRDALELGQILARANGAEMVIATAPADGGLSWRPLSGDAEDVGMRVLGVGFDGSGAAHEALDIAADLAIHNGGALRVYAVAPRLTTHPSPLDSQAPSVQSKAEKLREQLHDAVAELPTEARALPVFLWGTPSIELVAAAENGVDMMVLGARGGGRMQRALYGGVSGTVIQEARCPVLISPAGVKAPTAALA